MEYDAKVDNFVYTDPNYTESEPLINEGPVIVPQDPVSQTDEVPSSPEKLVLGIAGLCALSTVLYFGRKYYTKWTLKRKGVTSSQFGILQNYTHEFDLSDVSIISLVGGLHRIDERFQDPQYKDLIPAKLLSHRYLMHSIRLSIMKLLNKEDKLRSVEIKHLLDLSWGDYSNHINSL